MVAINDKNMDIIDIDGAHGILLLPQNIMAALNGISSEPGLLKIGPHPGLGPA